MQVNLARGWLGLNSKTTTNSGISWILEGFQGGDGGGRLDQLATQQTQGSKPRKHHQNSQITIKFFGAIFVGIFGLGQKTTKSS